MAADDIKDVSTRGALVAIAIATIVLAALVGVAVLRTGAVSKAPDKKKYQAVFLTNGQVYFGKLSGVGAEYASLTDVYYIQSNPNNQQASASPQANLSLVSLGNEIHGPDRSMQVAKNQIIFWENLKDSGKVVQAIKQDKSGNK